MTTAAFWFTACLVALAWLAAGAGVGVVVGRVIRNRDRQHQDDDR